MRYVISIILLCWKPIGSAHQLYHIHLKGIPVKLWPQILHNARFEILQSGWLGLLTPYFHYRWHKKKPQVRELRKPSKFKIAV